MWEGEREGGEEEECEEERLGMNKRKEGRKDRCL